MKSRRSKTLAVRISLDGVLTVEIGIDALKFATEHGQYRADGDIEDRSGIEVLNPRDFARSVARELMDEVGEDGSTPLTLALDRAIEAALESDTASVRLESDA